MCGVAIVLGDQSPEDSVNLMVTRLQHRGELTEVHHSRGVRAATRRLPIVDREHAIQPWIFADGTHVLSYNGELYNTAELRAELAVRGFRPETAADTELVALAFAAWGPDGVRHLDGEFAFGVALPREQRVYVARDPLGVKPLYFAFSDGDVLVASEVKALVPFGQSIHEVRPGHHGWLAGPDRVDLEPYFELPPEGAGIAEQDIETARGLVRGVVTEAIDRRLDTDLPIAVILSGGLDSTIVAARVARRHPDAVAVTVGTPSSPDIAFARRVAHDFGLRHEVVEIRPRDLTLRNVRTAIECSELSEYGDIINAVISIPLFERIRELGIKVAIGGDGSDELFGGYPMYDHIGVDQQRQLFLHKLANLGRTELQRVDRASMHAGVEMRVPFLDQAVVKAAMRLPASLKVRDGQEKWILRRAFEGVVPQYVIDRPKHGLSYSSGLHDRVRLYKPLFPRIYDASGYRLHAPLRRDFDTVLKSADHDLHAAKLDEVQPRDYTSIERLKDLVGAVRWNVQPAVMRAGERLRGRRN